MENEESVAVLQAEEERLRTLFRNVVRMSTAFPQLQELEEILQKVISGITQHLRFVSPEFTSVSNWIGSASAWYADGQRFDPATLLEILSLRPKYVVLISCNS